MSNQNKQIAKLISFEMNKIGLDKKSLSNLSKIPYSTLAPILLGERDFKLQQIIAICNALNVDARKLIDPYIDITNETCTETDLKFILSISTSSEMSFATIYSIDKKKMDCNTFKVSFSGGDKPHIFKEKLENIIATFQKQTNNTKIKNKNIAVIVSIINSEYAREVKTINTELSTIYHHFETISDANLNQLAYSSESGIFVTIENGCAIRYKENKTNKTVKLQAAGFPLTDVAGNHYIGCKAISHTIDVFDNIEPESPLSSIIMSIFNNEIDELVSRAYYNPRLEYLRASKIVKELLALNGKSYDIVLESFRLLKAKLEVIDNKLKKKLPIYLMGSSSNIYRNLFKKHYRVENTELNGIEVAKKGIDLLIEKLI